uniref:CCT domain-containing protein n=1 Tax=Oryza punctata TaxID=4537 RepID=A0A0E0LQQ9_ORYPU
MASSGGGGARRRKGRRGGRGKVKRKTKYLSLSRFLIKSEEEEVVRSPEVVVVELVPKEEAPSSPEDGGNGGEEEEEKPQMEPFALHPEPSTLFAAAPSLTDILGASVGGGGGGGGESSSAASPGVSGEKELPGEEDELARRALRGRERWVYCSSSSPSATTTTTTSSSCSSAASTGASSGGDGATAARSLLLKLDYEEILAAWAGRGSLYIGGAAATAATAGADHAAAELELDSVFVEVAASPEPAAAVAWSVAEPAARAEKVRRYKEKRQGRLFAKRIRYEVRRLNAVKRPRLKVRHFHYIFADLAPIRHFWFWCLNFLYRAIVANCLSEGPFHKGEGRRRNHIEKPAPAAYIAFPAPSNAMVLVVVERFDILLLHKIGQHGLPLFVSRLVWRTLRFRQVSIE